MVANVHNPVVVHVRDRHRPDRGRYGIDHQRRGRHARLHRGVRCSRCVVTDAARLDRYGEALTVFEFRLRAERDRNGEHDRAAVSDLAVVLGVGIQAGQGQHVRTHTRPHF